MVPHLLQLGVIPEAAPDLTGPHAEVPALTLVFDREGWSPDLFKRLARRGIACITWHKNFKGDDWPAQEFCALAVPVHGPAGTSTTTVDLAEQRIVLRNGLTVRQIRRRLANGRQVPVITSHPDALGAGRRRHVLALVAGELLEVPARAVQPRLFAHP